MTASAPIARRHAVGFPECAAMGTGCDGKAAGAGNQAHRLPPGTEPAARR